MKQAASILKASLENHESLSVSLFLTSGLTVAIIANNIISVRMAQRSPQSCSLLNNVILKGLGMKLNNAMSYVHIILHNREIHAACPHKILHWVNNRILPQCELHKLV